LCAGDKFKHVAERLRFVVAPLWSMVMTNEAKDTAESLKCAVLWSSLIGGLASLACCAGVIWLSIWLAPVTLEKDELTNLQKKLSGAEPAIGGNAYDESKKVASDLEAQKLNWSRTDQLYILVSRDSLQDLVQTLDQQSSALIEEKQTKKVAAALQIEKEHWKQIERGQSLSSHSSLSDLVRDLDVRISALNAVTQASKLESAHSVAQEAATTVQGFASKTSTLPNDAAWIVCMAFLVAEALLGWVVVTSLRDVHARQKDLADVKNRAIQFQKIETLLKSLPDAHPFESLYNFISNTSLPAISTLTKAINEAKTAGSTSVREAMEAVKTAFKDESTILDSAKDLLNKIDNVESKFASLDKLNAISTLTEIVSAAKAAENTYLASADSLRKAAEAVKGASKGINRAISADVSDLLDKIDNVKSSLGQLTSNNLQIKDEEGSDDDKSKAVDKAKTAGVTYLANVCEAAKAVTGASEKINEAILADVSKKLLDKIASVGRPTTEDLVTLWKENPFRDARVGSLGRFRDDDT